MGATGGKRSQPLLRFLQDPACSNKASAVTSLLGDIGHVSASPRPQFTHLYIGVTNAFPPP